MTSEQKLNSESNYENIHQEIRTKGWNMMALSDVLSLTSGKPKPKKALPSKPDDLYKYPVYGGNGITGYSNEYLIDYPVIIIGRVGEYCGVVHKVMSPSWITDNALYTNKFYEDINIDFLTYYLQKINLSRLRKESGQPLVSQKPILALKVLIPPLPEQHKIASVLSKVDEHISHTEAIIEKTEELKRGLMQQLLTKGIGHTKFKKTEIGEIPEEWDVIKLGEHSEGINYGYTASSQKEKVGPKFLRITDIQNGTVKWSDVPYCECSERDYEKYKLNESDIVFARTGATTGKSFLIKSPPKAVFASYLIKVTLKEQLKPSFVYYFFQSQLYWRQILSNVSGSAQGGVNATKLANLTLVLPSLPEQQKIASILSKVDDQLSQNQTYLSHLQELKKGLMQDLLTGKVRVTV